MCVYVYVCVEKSDHSGSTIIADLHILYLLSALWILNLLDRLP